MNTNNVEAALPHRKGMYGRRAKHAYVQPAHARRFKRELCHVLTSQDGTFQVLQGRGVAQLHAHMRQRSRELAVDDLADNVAFVVDTSTERLWVASVSWAKLTLFDAETGLRADSTELSSQIYHIWTARSDHKILYIAEKDSLSEYCCVDGKLQCRKRRTAKGFGGRCFASSTDGRLIAVGKDPAFSRQALCIYEVATMSMSSTAGDKDVICGVSFAGSRDRFLVGVSNSQHLRCWELEFDGGETSLPTLVLRCSKRLSYKPNGLLVLPSVELDKIEVLVFGAGGQLVQYIMEAAGFRSHRRYSQHVRGVSDVDLNLQSGLITSVSISHAYKFDAGLQGARLADLCRQEQLDHAFFRIFPLISVVAAYLP